MPSRFCTHCGSELPDGAQGSCPSCGAALPDGHEKKSEILAAILSLFIPGLGQSYNGNALKGVGLFLGLGIFGLLSIMLDSNLIFVNVVLWVIAVYDAYHDAGRMNRGEIPEKGQQILFFFGGALVLMIIFAVIFTGFILYAFASVYGVSQGPNDKTAELRILYNGSIYSDYGTGDCFSKKTLSGPIVIPFSTHGCHMSYAWFTKNDTIPGELRVDLIRGDTLVKSYTTATGTVHFRDIDDFLQQVAKEPGLVQKPAVTVRVLTEGNWSGSVDDLYGSQSDSGAGPATFTLTQPVLPLETCFRNPGNSPQVPITVEIYSGSVLLKRSDTKDATGQNCVEIQ